MVQKAAPDQGTCEAPHTSVIEVQSVLQRSILEICCPIRWHPHTQDLTLSGWAWFVHGVFGFGTQGILSAYFVARCLSSANTYKTTIPQIRGFQTQTHSSSELVPIHKKPGVDGLGLGGELFVWVWAASYLSGFGRRAIGLDLGGELFLEELSTSPLNFGKKQTRAVSSSWKSSPPRLSGDFGQIWPIPVVCIPLIHSLSFPIIPPSKPEPALPWVDWP